MHFSPENSGQSGVKTTEKCLLLTVPDQSPRDSRDYSAKAVKDLDRGFDSFCAVITRVSGVLTRTLNLAKFELYQI